MFNVPEGSLIVHDKKFNIKETYRVQYWNAANDPAGPSLWITIAGKDLNSKLLQKFKSPLIGLTLPLGDVRGEVNRNVD